MTKENAEDKLYVVGIGASAGGLQPIQELFDNISPDTGLCFIIVQHLSPNFKSLMNELLGKHTEMKISTAENNLTLQPNNIYLKPKNKDLIIKDGRLTLVEKEKKHGLNLPIDAFFHSLGEEFKEYSIGIVLSGTGTDGSRGIKTIKNSGGLVIVQSPESAQFDGMPNAAIESETADFILKPEDIAKELVRIPERSISFIGLDGDMDHDFEVVYKKITKLIFGYSGINLDLYKHNTIVRRLEKRIGITHKENLEEYYKLLSKSNIEKETFLKDCLIGVTNFFRDEEAYSIIQNEVIPDLFNSLDENEIFRVWIPGCSTGEEAYSIAILIDEFVKSRDIKKDYKIFATDINNDSVDFASGGEYSINLTSEITDERLKKYFIKSGDTFKVIKELRERIVFSRHDLLTDPPFLKVDLISCRNLLIYMKSESQNKILRNLLYSLKNNAYLALGNSEHLGDVKKYFKNVNSKWRVYKKSTDESLLPSELHKGGKLKIHKKKTQNYGKAQKGSYGKIDFEMKFLKHLGENHLPPSLYVNKDYQILYINGNLNDFIQFASGTIQQNLFKLIIDKDIIHVIRNGVRKLIGNKTSVLLKDVEFKSVNNNFIIDIQIDLAEIEGYNNDGFLIKFISKERAALEKKERKIIKAGDIAGQKVEDLEAELNKTKFELQQVIEAHETSNEELHASNEELLASNEELQSTNEELQSVNEELYTVNTELQEKNKELYDLNNDMSNLLDSTDIGTLFLDKKLRIRKFTPKLKEHFQLKEDDIGRPINSFAANFSEKVRNEIIKECRKVLNENGTVENEFEDDKGNSYLRKVTPFITSNGAVEGTVISFVDITRVIETEKALKEHEEFLRSIFENVDLAIKVIDVEDNNTFRIAQINHTYEKLAGITNEQVKGKQIKEILNIAKEDADTLVSKYEECVNTRKIIINEESFNYNNKSTWWMRRLTPLFNDKGNIYRIISASVDITERKLSEFKMQKFIDAVQQSPLLVIITNLKGEMEYVNPKVCEITGYSEKQLLGSRVSMLKSGLHDDKFYEDLWDTVLSGNIWKGVIINKNKHGKLYHVESIIKPVINNGEIISYIQIGQDITSIITTNKELESAKNKAEESDRLKSAFLANMSHEIRTPINSILGFIYLLKDVETTADERMEFIDRISKQVLYLLNLINDVIDISKIEAGIIDINYENVNLNELMEDVYFSIPQNVQRDDVKLILNSSAENDELISKTDPTRIKQIMMNLINNSLKFTEKGKVEFGYNLDGTDSIRFYVKDTGIGIPSDKIENVFDRFSKIEHKGLKDKPGGTGLGLAISKALVELMGGRIYVDTEVNVGTEISFVIPYLNGKNETILKKQKRIEDEFSLKDVKILVAEDLEDNFLTLKLSLEKYGAVIDRAYNGSEVVEKAGKNQYDIVLMDINMPILNGLDATRMIRQFDEKIPIIAVTAYAMKKDMAMAFEAGCNEYITKPLDFDVLFNVLSNHLNK
ncbi:MAG: chemotaxis protein CheB [Ignavibacteria bacterium]|jgi:two-component system CheB/CheR fusion protein